MRNITLQFKGSCAGCSYLHGANHAVFCHMNRLCYTDKSRGLSNTPKIYHLNKAYNHPYNWPLPGIPYRDWLKATDCEYFISSENGEEVNDGNSGKRK